MNHLANKARRIFCDSLRIKVQGGTGGHGLPKYGGIGGKGGDVYFACSTQIHRLDNMLKSPNYKAGWLTAGDGRSALRTRLMGEPGMDLIVRVPLGVTVSDLDGQLVGDLNDPKEKVIVALGGRGGDKFNDNQGFKGQMRHLRLDLKMMSDAVFVGFPNAGKSSLLRAVSNARPRVAAFPFTTLRPYLGIVEFPDYRRISMSDLPGLVEGAHKNLGLGHEFLKHIVRSRMLVFVIDVNPCDLGPNYPLRTPLETLCILNKEIELYDDTILNKPAILAISKVDTPNEGECAQKYDQFRQDFDRLYNHEGISQIPESLRPKRLIKFDDVLPISSEKQINIGRLKETVRQVIDQHEEVAKLARDKISTYEELQPLENNRLLQ